MNEGRRMRCGRTTWAAGPMTTVLALAGCGGGGTAPDAVHVDELPELALVEELRIGSRDDPDVGFTRIGTTLHVEPDGVWVAETADRQIRRYSLSGELLRTIGREGEGPGDFRSVGPFGFVGDTLWVRDGSLRRVTLFTREGGLLGTVSGSIEIPYTDDRGLTRSFHVYPGSLRPGGLFQSTANVGLMANLPDSMIMLPTVLFDMTGAVVDTLEVVPRRVSRTTRTVERANGRTFITVDSPPRDSVELRTGLDEDTATVSWHVPTSAADAVFDVARRRPSGDTVYQHRFRYDPMPVTEAHLDSLAASRARGQRNPADSARIHEVAREVTRRPPFHPPVRLQRAGEDASIWILLNDADPETYRWIVLTPDGEVRGVLALPSTAYPRRTESDHVWVAEIDELDVPWLVRYGLTTDEPS